MRTDSRAQIAFNRSTRHPPPQQWPQERVARQAKPDRARDVKTHAGIAEFNVTIGVVPASPELCHIGDDRARRGDDHIVRYGPLIEAADYNHFEIGETLNNPYGHFGRAALEMMRLGVR